MDADRRTDMLDWRTDGSDYDDVVTFADMNGDGTTDVVWSTRNHDTYLLDLAAVPTKAMLTKIDNGLGKGH